MTIKFFGFEAGKQGALSKENKDRAIYAGASIFAASLLVFSPKIFVISVLFLALGYLVTNPDKVQAQLDCFLK